jgi:hypothetical protein
MKACVNSLTIFGSAEDLEDMQNTIQEGSEVISLEKIAPTPQGIIDATNNDVISPKIIEQFGAINVNAWRLKNWSCLKNAYGSQMLEERSNLSLPRPIEEHLDNVPDKIKERMLNINSAMSLSFNTDESCNDAMEALSKKYPNVLIHYGFDSEAEDTCGWSAITNGEVITHEHYSSCLKSIRINVEPSTSHVKAALLEALDGQDNSN